MVREKLTNDATITDIVESLKRPVEYVRRVYGNMLDFEKEHGAAFVRIGMTGRGIAPNYRIEPGELDNYLDDKWLDCSAFSGLSHKKSDWGIYDLRGEHWSVKGMNCNEVQTLLGSLRNFKKSGRNAPRA